MSNATLRVIVFNPASGRRLDRNLVERVAAIIGAEGATTLLPTERGGHACDLVEQVLRSRRGQVTDVIALGGDGTLNEVVLGAWRAGAFEAGGPGLRVAVVPAGTTNVVARSLGLPREPEAAARAIASGRDRAIDLGLCRLAGEERPFVLACGIGLDAEVALAVPARLKRLLGRHAYSLTALQHCGGRDRGLVLEWVDAAGARGTSEAASAIVGNAPFYGGPARLSRAAAFDDGLLELALLSSTRLIPFVRACVTASLTQAADAPAVRVVHVRSVRAHASSDVAVHVDAEPAGTTPLAIEVLPGALSVRVP